MRIGNDISIRSNVGIIRRFVMLSCLLWALFFIGCTEKPENLPQEFILKCGTLVVSHTEFNDELDMKLAAYSFDLKSDPQAYNNVVLDLVSELSDELVFLTAAHERRITVTSQEVDAREAAIRADYPEDSFQQILLENAISYPVWKKKLKKDMIVEQLIQTDLIDAQEISTDDAMAFYRQYKKTDKEHSAVLDEEAFIERLRKAKSQEAYDGWIKKLQEQYPVEINKKAVAAFWVTAK